MIKRSTVPSGGDSERRSQRAKTTERTFPRAGEILLALRLTTASKFMCHVTKNPHDQRRRRDALLKSTNFRLLLLLAQRLSTVWWTSPRVP